MAELQPDTQGETALSNQGIKVVANRKALLAAARAGQRFIDTKLADSLPVAGCVLLESRDGELTLTSTGRFTWYRATVPAESLSDGAALVSCKQLRELLAASRGVEIGLEATSKDALAIGIDGCSGWIHSHDPSSFVAWPWTGTGGNHLIDLPWPMFRRLLTKIHHAIPEASEDEKFHAARLVVDGSGVAFSATDGHRVADARLELPAIDGAAETIMVPHAVAARLLSIKDETSARLFERDGYLLLTLHNGPRLCFRSAELSTFPAIGDLYRRSVKAPGAVVDRLALLAAAQRASALGGESPSLALRARRQSGTLLAETPKSAMTIGRVEQAIPAQIDGDFAAAINPGYLSDALLVNDADEVEIRVASPSAPVLVAPVVSGRSIERHFELIAPMNLDVS